MSRRIRRLYREVRKKKLNWARIDGRKGGRKNILLARKKIPIIFFRPRKTVNSARLLLGLRFPLVHMCLLPLITVRILSFSQVSRWNQQNILTCS